VHLRDQRYALLRVWHHILVDGLSARILQKEVSEAYAMAHAGQAVAHDQVIGEHGALVDCPAQAEELEHAEYVRSKLDAGADFAEIRGRFEHVYAAPLARERQRGRQTTDTAAGHNDGQVGLHHFFLPLLQRL
jgi:hypothetical protein